VHTYTLTVLVARMAGDGVPFVGDTSDQDFALVCSNCLLSFDIHPGLHLSPTAQTGTGYPGGMVSHRFAVENTGDYADAFFFEIEGDDWPAQVPQRVGPVPPGGSATVTVNVTIPNEPVLEGAVIASDTFTLTATSQLSNTVRSRVTGTTLVVTDPGVELSASQIGEGNLGEQVSYSFVLTNTGGYSDTFLLLAESTWTTKVSLESASELATGEAVTLTMIVDIPMGVVDGETEIAVLTAVSGCNQDAIARTSALTTARWRRYYFPLMFR
jgi:uncharacterized membrane protein